MHQLLSAALLAPLAAAARPALRRRSLIAAAPLTLLRPAHAADAPRYLEQKVVAELGADGQPVAYETVRRLTGEGTGLDLSRNQDISERIFIDAIQSYYFSGRAAGVRRARTLFFRRSVERRPRP